MQSAGYQLNQSYDFLPIQLFEVFGQSKRAAFAERRPAPMEERD